MSLETVFGGRPASPPQPPPRTAEVTQSDTSGIYCTPLSGDSRQALGPCLGGLRRRATSCPAGAHEHPLEQLPVGTIVLLQRTADGVWITAVHEGPLPR